MLRTQSKPILIFGLFSIDRQYTQELHESFEACEEFWVNLSLASFDHNEPDLQCCVRLSDA